MKPSVHDRYHVSLARRVTAPLRALPDFLILGAQKAGTTTLYDNLVRHPLVLPCDIKEVHFFDVNFFRGQNWYRSHFPLKSQVGEGKITGEGSPYYLFHPTVHQRVKSVCPGCKFLVMLRDPVDRAFSHYHHELRKGRESLSFEQALDAEAGRLEGQAEAVAGDPRAQSMALQHFSYLARGRYAEQLERWFSVFPRDQFLILFSSSLNSEFGSTMSRVYSFLGLPSTSIDKPRHSNVGKYDEMPAESRQFLQEYFAEPDKQLAELLDCELPWRKNSDR
jgi:hypothetical protein